MGSRTVLRSPKRIYSACLSDIRPLYRSLLFSEPSPDVFDALLYRWTLLKVDLKPHDYAVIFKTVSKWRLSVKPDVMRGLIDSLAGLVPEFASRDAAVTICALSRIVGASSDVINALVTAFLSQSEKVPVHLQTQTLLALHSLRSPRFSEVRAKLAATIDASVHLDQKSASILAALSLRPSPALEEIVDEPFEETESTSVNEAFARLLLKTCLRKLAMMNSTDLLFLGEALSLAKEREISDLLLDTPFYFRLRHQLPIFSLGEISRLLRICNPYVFPDFRFAVIFAELRFRLAAASGVQLLDWLAVLSEWSEFYRSSQNSPEFVSIAEELVGAAAGQAKRKTLDVTHVLSFLTSVRNFQSHNFKLRGVQASLHSLLTVLQSADSSMASEVVQECLSLHVRNVHLEKFTKRIFSVEPLSLVKLDLLALPFPFNIRSVDHMHAWAILQLLQADPASSHLNFAVARPTDSSASLQFFLHDAAVGLLTDGRLDTSDLLFKRLGQDNPTPSACQKESWQDFSHSAGNVTAVDLPSLAAHLAGQSSESGFPCVSRDRGVLVVSVAEWWGEDVVVAADRALVEALRRCGWRVVERRASDDLQTVLAKIASLVV